MDQETFLHARCYDRRVDWESRLAGEWPFFRKLFADNGVRSVLDCACGTGRHAILFSQKGYSACGSDIDAGMIELARENAREAGAGVRFVRAAFSELSKSFGGERFDAILCTGNSLGQLDDYHDLHVALRNMASLLAPRGILILHVLNYPRLMEKKVEELPPRHIRSGDAEFLFLKTFRADGPRVGIEFTDIEGRGGKWSRLSHAGSLLPILPAHLDRASAAVGLAVAGRFGDYSFSPFDIRSSKDYITVSRPGEREGERSGGDA